MSAKLEGLEAITVARYLLVARYLEGQAIMPRPARVESRDKFQRYRAAQKKRGMKLVRLWVPDPKAPTFRREARRQAQLLRGAPEEQEALDFIEAAGNWDAGT